jgi:hypothetical protein
MMRRTTSAPTGGLIISASSVPPSGISPVPLTAAAR